MELIRRLQYLLGRHRFEAELREEMDAHLAMLAEGTDAVSARRQLGNVTRWQEMSREVWMWNWLQSILRDVGYGGRLLLRSPGFTACVPFVSNWTWGDHGHLFFNECPSFQNAAHSRSKTVVNRATTQKKIGTTISRTASSMPSEKQTELVFLCLPWAVIMCK